MLETQILGKNLFPIPQSRKRKTAGKAACPINQGTHVEIQALLVQVDEWLTMPMLLWSFSTGGVAY
jgi:hypothetical protein